METRFDDLEITTNKTVEGRLIDGHVIPGRTVWKAQQQHYKNAESLNKRKAQEAAIA